tara:strand:+ start:102 stop:1208 length:1107 start_codon:yes stop_codon:yes gene_type:complete
MRKVPFFDYPQHWLRDREDMLSIIDKTASQGGFIMQEDLELFEKELADYVNCSFSLGVANATDAMEIYLQALGVGHGDEIIISAHTMLATASAVVMAGAKPVPVDIGEDNLICSESIEKSINQNTVAIMPTQLNGRTCDMENIQHLTEKHSLLLVEDSAQALGSKFKGKSAGTFGSAGCISFFPAKVVGCFGDAGSILTNDESLFNKMYAIRDHGRDKDGEVICWGRNSRLDNIQAAILRSKLDSYDEVISKRRLVATIYDERLNEINEIKLPPGPNDSEHHFDIYQNYEIEAEDRDSLKEYLEKNNVGTLIQWGGKAINHFKNLGFDQNLPNTKRFFDNCLMLPMNIFIDDDDVHYVCDKIIEFYRR